MKNIKSIIVKGHMTGFGIVQFDGKDQKWVHNRCKGIQRAENDNVSFAKASFSEKMGEDGKTLLSKNVKISPDGLRHAIHIEEHPFHSPNIAYNADLKVKFQANMGTLQRGYLIASESSSERKKSCYAITAATEVSGAVPILEFFSRSGEKEKNAGKEVTEDKGTTIHSKDTIGASKYVFTAFIDPSELGFVSISDLQDRRAIIDDNEALFVKELAQNLGSPVSGSKYFVKKGSAYQIPEKGILLSEAQVKLLVVDLVQKMCLVDIRKSQGGYAKVDSLSIKMVVNPLMDTEQDPNGWLDVKKDGRTDMSVVGKALESFVETYIPVDVDEALEALSSLSEAKSASKTAKSEKKATEKALKDNLKATKTATK